MDSENNLLLPGIYLSQARALVADVLNGKPTTSQASKHFDFEILISLYPDLASESRDFRDTCFKEGLSFVSQMGGKKVQVTYSPRNKRLRKTKNPAESKWKKIFQKK